MDIVVPWGIFGAGNIGDESMLQGFARIISQIPGIKKIQVASRNPAQTARAEPSLRYYKYKGLSLSQKLLINRSRVCLIVGDTPITDEVGDWPLEELALLVGYARRKRKIVVFIGIGTEPLQAKKSERIVSRILAPNVAAWSVRSDFDRDRLIGYGVAPENISVAADMAWLVEDAASDFGKEFLSRLNRDISGPLLGVNATNFAYIERLNRNWFKELAAFLDWLIQTRNISVLFLCNEIRCDERFDQSAGKRVLDHMRHQNRAFLCPNRYFTPQEMLSLIGCCWMTLGMRYHFLVFSAMKGVPFIGINRSAKMDDLCSDMEWPFCLSLPEFCLSRVQHAFSEIENTKEKYTAHLRHYSDIMRKRALLNSSVFEYVNKKR
jgi:polysaccharide pyruvyl transferase WcaK-like protein